VYKTEDAGVRNRSLAPPVIVIGMHRSGTSMVARILEELGLFVGEKKDRYYEALFFLRLNNWLLRQSGGAWDHPEPIKFLLRSEEVRRLCTDYIRNLMRTPRITNYMGWRRYLQHRSPERMGIPWGWKDPRNTYTLPLWLDLFPQARVIHVYRNGVDVASSLRVREEGFLARSQVLHGKRKYLYALRPKRGGFMGSLRCTSLEGGFSLWESYTEEARRHVRRLGNQAVEIGYEGFLAEPREHLALLAGFCDLKAGKSAVASAAGGVRQDRAYLYKNDPGLRVFAERVADRLAAQGY
jgi:hypothetical protein